MTMRRELPICSSACMILPSGAALRITSFAPNARLYQSIDWAALSNVSCGVIVWYPSGAGLHDFAMCPPRIAKIEAGHVPPAEREMSALGVQATVASQYMKRSG